MNHVIIGTAGHIDHGKTELIRALTGRDTDTLKEEKKRGISIDLGFTWFDLPGEGRAGVIDVPGHEKFLPNMLAGVCGMDLVLLVIALDEGMKPQTREHMEILRQLRIPGGIVVLTKADLADEEWAELMEEEIRGELSGTMFASWPVVRVSSLQNRGIEALKKEIADQARKLRRTRNIRGRFRLPVDRIFSVPGFGTVIAGTLLEGEIHCEEEVMLYPAGQRARVRSLQVHGEPVETAFAGQRVALNLIGVKKEELYRGCVAAYPDSLCPAERLDVELQLAKDTERTVKHQSRLHLHVGTAETVCRVILLEKQELKAGERGYAQLVPEKPLSLKRGDRFIVRFYSPLETVGGGIVLDEHAQKHRIRDERVLTFLRNIRENRTDEIVRQILRSAAEKPASEAELEEQIPLPKEQWTELLEDLTEQRECIRLPGKKRRFYWYWEGEDRARRELEELLRTYHQKRPYSRGIEKTELKKTGFLKGWEADRLEAFLEHLQKQERIRIEENRLCLWKFTVTEEERAQAELELWCKKIREAGFHLLDRSQLFSEESTEGGPSPEGAGKKGKMPKSMISSRQDREDLLEYFCASGTLIKIGEDFYTAPELAEEARRRVEEYFRTNETISFSALRDLLGTTRRSARPFMTYLDEAGVTAYFGRETERKEAEKREPDQG